MNDDNFVIYATLNPSMNKQYGCSDFLGNIECKTCMLLFKNRANSLSSASENRSATIGKLLEQ